MLEKPDLQDERLATCLWDEYDLRAVQVAFLPLGADRNTAVYRIVADDQTAYFLKLRRADFDEVSVALPRFLREQGINQVIAPLRSKTGQLWVRLGTFTAILYPYVEGSDGYAVALLDRHWVEYGTALKNIHTVVLPPALRGRVRRETYSPHWREALKAFMEQVSDGEYAEPLAANLAAFLRARSDQILDLVQRTEHLAVTLAAQTSQFVLCHSDIHAGNVLICADGAFYIVDWDSPILAPKERDLMYIGGGQMADWRTPEEEEALFYQGYGQTQIDPVAMAYYRYERIVEDLAVECEQIFQIRGSVEDREQSFYYLKSNFLSNGVLALAYRSDQTLRAG